MQTNEIGNKDQRDIMGGFNHIKENYFAVENILKTKNKSFLPGL